MLSLALGGESLIEIVGLSPMCVIAQSKNSVYQLKATMSRVQNSLEVLSTSSAIPNQRKWCVLLSAVSSIVTPQLEEKFMSWIRPAPIMALGDELQRYVLDFTVDG